MTHTTKNSSDLNSQFPPRDIVSRVWHELEEAIKDRHHDWRTPVLATIGLDGHPQARTIVLRNANSTLWTLDAYTDMRSFKCQELIKCEHAQLVFWSSKLSWQLRVSVQTSVHVNGDLVKAAWACVSQSKAAKDYLSKQPPRSPIISNTNREQSLLLAPLNHQLAVLSFRVKSMDWLELGQSVHRCAQINPDGTVYPLSP